MEKDKTDIAYQAYKGPNKALSSAARGFLQAKAAGFTGLFVGGALGAAFHKPINGFIARYPKLDSWIDQSSQLVGGKFFGRLFGGEGRFKTAALGAIVTNSCAGWVAMAHGAFKGYKDSDAGQKQFKEAQSEIITLRTQLCDAPTNSVASDSTVAEDTIAQHSSKGISG